ncbi:hypothetical protein [Streptomyces diastatochromogenes]|nr:hypothetical protein [Streptomyces diastatochromogenes]MCZ0985109.1 hypothetical protein [Streptomyces diastatochromogenes]
MPTPLDHEFVRAAARPVGGQARTRRAIPASHGMATSGKKG